MPVPEYPRSPFPEDSESIHRKRILFQAKDLEPNPRDNNIYDIMHYVAATSLFDTTEGRLVELFVGINNVELRGWA